MEIIAKGAGAAFVKGTSRHLFALLILRFSFGLVRFGMAWYGVVRLGWVKFGWYGLGRRQTLAFCHSRCGLVWLGWFGLFLASGGCSFTDWGDCHGLEKRLVLVLLIVFGRLR